MRTRILAAVFIFVTLCLFAVGLGRLAAVGLVNLWVGTGIVTTVALLGGVAILELAGCEEVRACAHMRRAILWARWRRHWYLFFKGMWRGECAITYVDYHNRRRLVCLASGDTHAAHTGEGQRIWWEREGIEPWWRAR